MLDRLTADFARQVMEALRKASLDDLGGRSSAALPPSARRTRPRKPKPTRPAARVTRSSRSPRSARRSPAPKLAVASSVVGALAPSALDARNEKAFQVMKAAVLRVLESRGSKGATAAQLDAELALQGFAPVADVMSPLLESGEVRDTGFRRASGGNATSPVYILAL